MVRKMLLPRMNGPGRVVVTALAFVLVTGARGQTTDPRTFFLQSGGDSLWVRHFPPPDAAGSTAVLLVPGWPATGGDVLGLGAALSAGGLHVFVVHPRGHEGSGGEATFANALEDVGVLWAWLASRDGGGALGLDAGRRVLAGYSWGGGIALAFAAREKSVARVVSIAGSDHGVFIRRIDSDPEYAALYRGALESTRAPDGPVRFDVDATLDELRSGQAVHDLATIAPRLADRDILIVAGWDDEQVEIEFQVLPFYRALRAAGADGVRLLSFQDGHGFRHSREALAAGVLDWLRGESGNFTGEIKPVLYVSDVEKSAPFYRDVLGFDFDGFAGPEGQPYYAEMVARDLKFGLHEPTSDEQQDMVGRQRLYFRVRDVNAQRARVVERGARAGEIRETGWMDMFIVHDPDGNTIVFAETDPARHTVNPWNTRPEASAK